ncbi:MAG TPA: XRE family transcriptional regulator [Candidatus Polarisedimenticolaceae bacterium]|nr:XRE family transcriptional regulator [Candidatus Polarisedimenticolaceae bacterium]
MLSDTLTEGLSVYEIGAKVRSLRLRKKLGLVELGQHTGLSPALLSKIERGKLFPTLPTLLRIALVFGVGLEHFFAAKDDEEPVAVVRKAERRRFPDRPGASPVSYWFESLDFRAVDRKLNAYLAEFEPIEAEEVVPHAHPGVEFVYVLSGTLALVFGAEEQDLDAGDAAYFSSSRPHGYRRAGKERCTAIVISVP